MHGDDHPASKPADRGDKTMLQQATRQCRDGCALCRKIGCAFAEPCRQADAALSVIVVGEEAMFVTAISVSLCHRMFPGFQRCCASVVVLALFSRGLLM